MTSGITRRSTARAALRFQNSEYRLIATSTTTSSATGTEIDE
jgi:hypothetical protein